MQFPFRGLGQALADLRECGWVAVEPHLMERNREGRVEKDLSGGVDVYAEMKGIKWTTKFSQTFLEYPERLRQGEPFSFVNSAFTDEFELVT